MRWNLRALLPKGCIIIFFFCGAGDQRAQVPCKRETIAWDSTGASGAAASGNPYPTIGSIPTPAGYRRVVTGEESFGAWLRQILLKKDKTVYLYDGSPKRNQEAQFAVLAVSVGNKDLQQSADAMMRLRAEYWYSRKKFAAIEFITGQGLRLNFSQWASGRRVRLSGDRLVQYGQQPGPSRASRSSASSGPVGPFCADRGCFSAYLATVFSYCGTLSLEKQLIPVPDFGNMQIGDVLIRGGAPGHAMLVVDMAVDSLGHAVYMLAQSYMPAQDIHIVRNPLEKSRHRGSLSPWYQLDKGDPVIETPEWTFYTRQLRTWPKGSGG